MKLSIVIRRCLLGWVLIAVLGTQALGLMHGVAHGHPGGAVHAQALPDAASDAPAQAPADSWLHALFAAHQGYSGCLSYDAVGHGGPAPPPVLVAPVLPPAQGCMPPVRTVVAQFRAAPFQARGPPVSR